MALEPDIQTEGQAPPVQPVTPPAPPMPMGEEEGELHDIGEMDFEFLTAGDPAVAPQDAVNRMMENLTPEEQSEIAGLVPYVERFFILQFKAETGEYPPEPEVEPEGGGGVTIDEYRAMSPEEQIANSMQEEVGSPVLKPRSSFDRSPSRIPEAVLEPEMAQAPVQENIEPAMQKGGITPKQQVREDIPQGKPVPAGPVGEVAVEGKDESGVADDVKTKSDGFVLSKGAVIANGKMYIMDLINDAIESLRKKGKIADTEQIPESAEDILVSNGEFVIPDIIAQEIGYKRLEKMNKRGAELTEQLIAEHEQKQGQQQQAALVPGLQEGNTVLPDNSKIPPPVPGEKPLAGDLNESQVPHRNMTPEELEQQAQDQQVEMAKIEFTMPPANQPHIEQMKELNLEKPIDWTPKQLSFSVEPIDDETFIKFYRYHNPGVTGSADYRLGPNFAAGLPDIFKSHPPTEKITQTIRNVLPAFGELDHYGFWSVNLFEKLAAKESSSGKNLISEKNENGSRDYGVWQLNSFVLDDTMRNKDSFKYSFSTYWGDAAENLTGLTAKQVREQYLENPKEFLKSVTNDYELNLALVLAISIMPRLKAKGKEIVKD